MNIFCGKGRIEAINRIEEYILDLAFLVLSFERALKLKKNYVDS